MLAIVRHAVVLLIANADECINHTVTALAAIGCNPHRARPCANLDGAHSYDAALLIARSTDTWAAGVLDRLQASDVACASLILLDAGGPESVAEFFRRGAVDCLVGPVSDLELIEGVVCVIQSTRRWRARYSRARQFAVPRPRAIADPNRAMAGVFEPVGQARLDARADLAPSREQKIDKLVERVAEANGLTPRERQVLYWLLLGHRYSDIASALGVAPRTAKFHAANLLQKLELDSRYDLSRLLVDEFEDAHE